MARGKSPELPAQAILFFESVLKDSHGKHKLSFSSKASALKLTGFAFNLKIKYYETVKSMKLTGCTLSPKAEML